MDQPFRFSLYLKRLVRHWRLILIPTGVALAVAVVLSWLMPVRYTAEAVMVAPKPQLVWRWENKVYDVVDLRFDWRSEVMPLVTTQRAATLALEAVGDQLSRSYTPEEVVAATSVKPGAGSMFAIRVSVANGEDAALLANGLAQALPQLVAEIYAGSEEAFDDARQEVKASYETWDDRWRAFQAQYGIGLNLTGDLAGTGEDRVVGNQSTIKMQLSLKSSETAALEALLANVKVVKGALDAGADYPHLALLDVPELARYGLDYARLQRLSPDELADVLAELLPQVEGDVAALRQEVADLQKEMAELLREKDKIQINRNVWLASWQALEDKQVEFDVKRIVEGQRIHQVGEAKPSARPSQPNWVLNLTLALVAGLLTGLFLAVAAVYFGGEAED